MLYAHFTWLHTRRHTCSHRTWGTAGGDLKMRLRKNSYIASDCFPPHAVLIQKAYLSTMTLILNSSLCCKTVGVTLWLS